MNWVRILCLPCLLHLFPLLFNRVSCICLFTCLLVYSSGSIYCSRVEISILSGLAYLKRFQFPLFAFVSHI
ncbi:hypothetical protein P175DRAFT_0300208 [Aspergillus ochraceoroseus IBT 24754]|uniref:Uncharacterized protein n=1 Tax=Aspergillus ochraceoroseus IBT 24754 TaxID=1392256 RepID=A0A2T5LSY1_9EURO|nr:uncharacterized protein P175DRAFT_0300208 [Aspergillus ochraceoroseus IBT 24754]PTU19387.1 hypothetical protein P175DRAFT_0300208 [Aspergillus ochraceoroseus IBT 24754]